MVNHPNRSKRRQLTEAQDIALERVARDAWNPLSQLSTAIKILEDAGLEHDAHQFRRAWLIVNKWRHDTKTARAKAERTPI